MLVGLIGMGLFGIVSLFLIHLYEKDVTEPTVTKAAGQTQTVTTPQTSSSKDKLPLPPKRLR
jgi:hypothetical protein